MTANPNRIPVTRPYFPEAMIDGILGDLRGLFENRQIAPGAFADRLEVAFAALCGVEHAVSVNSATTALQIALRYFGAKGGEVLVPAASFLTDVSAVLFEGGTPVLADIDPETMAVTPESLEARRTERTKGVIWVHLTGVVSPDFARIKDYCRANGLFLIEDASHAHGARFGDRVAGNFGDVGVFSFYPTKVMTTGAGGMLTTNDPELRRFARQLRMFGKEEETDQIVELGNDWFLDDIRAAIGLRQVEGLGDHLARRREIAAAYHQALSNQPGLLLVDLPEGSAPSWYQYAVFVQDYVDYRAVASTMREAGIQTKRIYRPVHKEVVFAHLDDGRYRGAEHLLDRSMCLPMYPELDEDQIARVTRTLIAAARSAG